MYELVACSVSVSADAFVSSAFAHVAGEPVGRCAWSEVFAADALVSAAFEHAVPRPACELVFEHAVPVPLCELVLGHAVPEHVEASGSGSAAMPVGCSACAEPVAVDASVTAAVGQEFEHDGAACAFALSRKGSGWESAVRECSLRSGPKCVCSACVGMSRVCTKCVCVGCVGTGCACKVVFSAIPDAGCCDSAVHDCGTSSRHASESADAPGLVFEHPADSCGSESTALECKACLNHDCIHKVSMSCVGTQVSKLVSANVSAAFGDGTLLLCRVCVPPVVRDVVLKSVAVVCAVCGSASAALPVGGVLAQTEVKVCGSSSAAEPIVGCSACSKPLRDDACDSAVSGDDELLLSTVVEPLVVKVVKAFGNEATLQRPEGSVKLEFVSGPEFVVESDSDNVVSGSTSAGQVSSRGEGQSCGSLSCSDDPAQTLAPEAQKRSATASSVEPKSALHGSFAPAVFAPQKRESR